MLLIEIIILALIQGFTEFLPISSSAHLILPSVFLGFADQGLTFDVATHFGTLVAVLIYFRKDLQRLICAGIAPCIGQPWQKESKLSWSLVVASIPVACAGFLLHDWVAVGARSGWVIALSTICFGLLLWWSDRQPQTRKTLEQIRWRDAIVIGLAQALALIPGTSRSGITITAGRFLGFNRVESARYSFLLAIPAILMAVGYESLKLVQSPQLEWVWLELCMGGAIAFVSALLCIHLFLQWIEKIGLLPFVIYRVILGTVLLVFVYI